MHAMPRSAQGRRRPLRLGGGVFAAALLALALAAPAALAGAKHITPGGPISDILVTDKLGCQLQHLAYPGGGQFYNSEADIANGCGAFLHVDDIGLYGFGAAEGGQGAPNTFTPESQSEVTGSGTTADPYRLETVADAEGTGLRLTQVDTYVDGSESYTTSIKVENLGDEARSAKLYRFGDCKIGNDDISSAKLSDEGGALCFQPDGDDLAPLALEFTPISGGSHYGAGDYFSVGQPIVDGASMPDLAGPDAPGQTDSFIGLSWEIDIPVGGSVTRSFKTTAASGSRLLTTKTADAPTTPEGGTNGYTIKVKNRTGQTQTVNEIVDTLPVGFTIEPGTTSGLTTSDPTVEGRELTFEGDFTIAAGATETLHFEVNAPAVEQRHFNSAEARTSMGTYVTGETAPINVENAAPEPVDDTFTTDEDTPLQQPADGLLANDGDPGNDPMIALVETQPEHGTVSVNSNGSFFYVPDPNFYGTDSFTYRASDNGGLSTVATAQIEVAPQDDPPQPTGVADTYSGTEDSPITRPAPGVLANDSEVDGDPTTAVLAQSPNNGNVTLNADGSFTYTPAPNFHGEDYFTYHVVSGGVQSAPVTVDLTVESVNDAPQADADSYSVAEDGTLERAAPGVLEGDVDAEEDEMSAQVVSEPAHGTLDLDPDGSFSYEPDADYHGADSFTYRASDATAQSSPATVQIEVTPVDDPPRASDDAYTVGEDATLTRSAAQGVLNNDSDPEGDGFVAELAAGPAHGTVQLSADGSFVYTPAANYSGTDSFTYRPKAGAVLGPAATVTITVQGSNDAPNATDDAYSTREDTRLSISAPGVLRNDSDPDGPAKTASVVTQPRHGSLSLSAAGSLTYTPHANYGGADSFTYRVSDGAGGTDTATVRLTVTAVNDAPAAKTDSYRAKKNVKLSVRPKGVLTNDTDPERSKLTAVFATRPRNGTLSLKSDGSFTFTPKRNYVGSDSFTYKARDSQGGLSRPTTVRITVAR